MLDTFSEVFVRQALSCCADLGWWQKNVQQSFNGLVQGKIERKSIMVFANVFS